MKKLQLLDCTLRDGGRIIDCGFTDYEICGIVSKLEEAKCDIIELGFLRNISNYSGNSTYFACVDDANRIINAINCQNDVKQSKYVLFVDFGLYEIEKLTPRTKNGVSGIRYGFTYRNLQENRYKIQQEMLLIKELGYDLYVQDVNTVGYTKEQLMNLVLFINAVQPVSFGLVDTYGTLYLDECEAIYDQIDTFLADEIAIDFHAHNNMEMAFALTQNVISKADCKRKLIIDATLNGMGKCAGNLKTELIADYLYRKCNVNIDVDIILDCIDQYIYPFAKKNSWGYSVPAFLAGLYRAHPNNIIYLTDKYRLTNRDIKYIISGIDEETRQRYDYENIDRIYREYGNNRVDDSNIYKSLSELYAEKEVLIIAPGQSVEREFDKIQAYIVENNPIVIAINFVPKFSKCDFYFFANSLRWSNYSKTIDKSKCILSSNIHNDCGVAKIVNYTSLIEDDSFVCDNSTIMLLNLLRKINIEKISIAGFDGLNPHKPNYVDASFRDENTIDEIEKMNSEIKRLFKRMVCRLDGKTEVVFLTESEYQN